MSDTVTMWKGRQTLPTFQHGYRTRGVRLQVTSLRSPRRIEDLRLEAYKWVDRLHEAGQHWWPTLTFAPTRYNTRPYHSLSSSAGVASHLSPQSLITEGLLDANECHRHFAPGAVDYASVIPFQEHTVGATWNRFTRMGCGDLRRDYEEYRLERASWLDDYALVQALKDKDAETHDFEWTDDPIDRSQGASAAAESELTEDIDRIRFEQFLVSRQGDKLDEDMPSRRVTLIGDLPLFVSPDSSDIWTNPDLFHLDGKRRPKFLARVFAGCFSADRQLSRDSAYNWDALRETGDHSWIGRFRAFLSGLDLIRLNHIRGFAADSQMPFGAPTAPKRPWQPGPRAEFFRRVEAEVSGPLFTAEAPGLIARDVVTLPDQFRIPGTGVLRFAFDGQEDNRDIRKNFVSNTVAYTGTHDTPACRKWFQTINGSQRKSRSARYCNDVGGVSIEPGLALISAAWRSPATVAVAPLQNLLNPGPQGRMKVAGHARGNSWRWRCTWEMLTARPFAWFRDLTGKAERIADFDRRWRRKPALGRPSSRDRKPCPLSLTVINEEVGVYGH